MVTEQHLKAPFPYFGGKSKVALEVWKRFGPVKNYVEPFFGSGALLLGRPDAPMTEKVNDADGLVANFWRALQSAPAEVARFADWPVNENDLHARHAWLVSRKESLQAKLEGDPDYFDAQVAGWWVWGMACWIGSGFCSGRGPWQVHEVAGIRQLVHVGDQGRGIHRGNGCERKRPQCAGGDRGVARVSLANSESRISNGEKGNERSRPALGTAGQALNRKRQRLPGVAETGVNACADLIAYFQELAARLRRVRVCCGDWSRVCGPSVTHKHGVTAVFLDPPYADTAGRASDLYRVDCESVAHAVREWAIREGQNPLMRIALCGYEGEHQMPADWKVFGWNAGAGFSGQGKEQTGNGKRERIWFSPHCLNPEPELF